MFLSRCPINTERRDARLLLASAHRIHGAVLAAFPPDQRSATEDGRILWRLDQSPHQTLLYAVSPHRPDFTHLVESAGWPSTTSWETRDYTPILDRLAEGQRYAFRLTANPTQAKRIDPAGRSQRLAHITVGQQTEWFLDRTRRHGFAIPEGADKEPDVAIHRRTTLKFTRDRRTVTIATATYEGILEVTDPDVMRTTLSTGLGPAKGYGCGLLTLAKPG